MSAPDFLFIDTILCSYRLGGVRNDEQKRALLAAARAASDAMGFMTALENFGVSRRSQLYVIAGKVISAHSYYCCQYPQFLGLPRQGEPLPQFLDNPNVITLVEGLLTRRQQQSFFQAYWWFVHNHQQVYFDPKKGQLIGIYATESHDNDSTLERFERYMMALSHSSKSAVRSQFESIPIDIILAVMKRSFLREGASEA